MFPKRAPHHALIVLGMGLLALGNLSHYVWKPATEGAANLADGVSGLLMGAAIGVLLLAVRRGSCASHPER